MDVRPPSQSLLQTQQTPGGLTESKHQGIWININQY